MVMYSWNATDPWSGFRHLLWFLVYDGSGRPRHTELRSTPEAKRGLERSWLDADMRQL